MRTKSSHKYSAVAHKHEKPVINCLMELARIGWRFGLDPPNIIRMEREIDKEEKQVFQPPPFIPTPVEIIPKKPEEKPVERPPSAKSEKVDLHTEVCPFVHKTFIDKLRTVCANIYSLINRLLDVK